MFEASLVESTPILQTRSRLPLLLSLLGQASVAGCLLLLPVLHPESLPLAIPRLSLSAPRLQPVPPPPPAVSQPLHAALSSAPASSTPTAAARSLSQAFQSTAQPLDAPALGIGVNLGLGAPSPLTALTAAGPLGAHVMVARAAAVSTQGPLRISRGVSAGLLIDPIRPEYPAIARMSRTQGTVVVQAIISKSGSIESAHAISGPAMLQPAALEAVRRARYRPFLLNDAPTEVETTISIVFTLGG